MLALAGFLTGVPLAELPNSMRGTPNGSTVDSWPWIWKEFKKEGFLTMFLQDSPQIGPFQFRMLGFQHQPTDYYGRNFYLLAEDFIDKQKAPTDFCLGGRPKHIVFLEYIHEFLRQHGNKRFFLFANSLEFSHDDIAKV